MFKAYNFTQVLREPGSKWEVHIDVEQGYGYYEHDTFGEGGGLWFVKHASGKWELADYDGCSELPMNVFKAIRNAGHIADMSFAP